MTVTRINPTQANSLKDQGNNTDITAQYSGQGVAATGWACMWDGYKIAAVDVSNLVKKAHVGDYYSAAWTADSSSANKAVLSGTITLPAGTYVASITLPIISTSVFTCSLFNVSTNDIIDSKWFHGGASHSSKTGILKLTAQTSVHICSSQSGACTFSYKERGGLVAVRIA